MKFYHIFRTNDTNEEVECTIPLTYLKDVEFKGEVTFTPPAALILSEEAVTWDENLGTDKMLSGKDGVTVGTVEENRILLTANADEEDALLTVTSAPLTEARTITFPDATGTVALTSGLLLKEVRDIPVSFEEGEVLKICLYFPYKVTINKIRAIATKAIAATDSATITCGNATGASTGGVITFAAEDAIATKKTVTPSTNNVVLADEHYYLTTAKTTPGGKAIVSIEYTRTA